MTRLSPAQRRWAFAVAGEIVASFEDPRWVAGAGASAFSAVVMGRYHGASPERQELLYNLILADIRDLTGYTGPYRPFRETP